MTESEHYLRGLEYFNNGDYDRAIKDFKTALKIEPDYRFAKDKLYWAYCNRAAKYRGEMGLDLLNPDYAKGRTKELNLAIADYTEAINLKPDEISSTYMCRAIVYNMKGENEKAIADLEVILKIDPNDATAKEFIELMQNPVSQPPEENEVDEKKSREEKKAAEKLIKEAKQGDARAQYILGIMYNEGEGVPQDIAKAKELLNKAVAQGWDAAKDILDEIKAAELKTAKQGKAI